MAENNLVNVKVKSGTFYVSSKEEKGEGWEKNTFPNPKNKEETLTRWHKNISIKGKVTYLTMDDDKYQGKVLSMIVAGESESYALKIPIMDAGGSVKTTNQYFNSLVGSLENVKKGDEVTMFVNNKNEDKNGRLYRNIVTLNADGKLIKSNFNFSEVPKWKSEEGEDEFGDKKTKWDASPTNKFYIDLFKKIVADFGKGGESTQTNSEPQQTPTATPQQAFETTNNKSFIPEDDSLPF